MVRTLLSALLGVLWIVAAPADAGLAKKRALLIGIDDYEVVPDLSGAVNDVELMKSILIGKFNFPARNVKVLKNAQATHRGVVEAIRSHLIERSRPGDIVILHYSGHGSRMPDASGDEIDGFDETIVAHDSRSAGVFDVTDDQINGLLAELTSKTKHVTFVFDSCHSGAATRGGSATRIVEPDGRPAPPPPDYAVGTPRGGEGDADIRAYGSDYVLISGSRATELANETTFNGRRYGAMTWHLARALGSAGERSTYRSVMDEVAAEVNSRYPSQHPQIEGPGMDLKIFSADRINTVPYVLAEPQGGDNVEISAGGIHGLSEGSELEVYPPEAVDFAKDSPVAKVVLTSVGDFAATAVVTEGGPVAPGSKAVVSAVVHGDARVPVYVDAARHGLLNPVARALDRYGAVGLVETVYSARLIVTVEDRSAMIKSGDLELMVPPVPLADPGVEDRVVRQVQDIVHWLNIIDLHSPSGAIDVEFDVRRRGDPPGSTAPAVVHPGTQLTYRVRSRDEAPLYVYVLDASSDGSVALLYPRVSGAQEELPPGGTLERSIEMFLPEGHGEVTDVLKVIATTRPIDPSVFPQGAIRGAAVSDTLDPQDPLAAFLARSLRGLSRGGRPVEVNSWATLQRRVVVRRPGSDT